jgi:hypothetical protein
MPGELCFADQRPPRSFVASMTSGVEGVVDGMLGTFADSALPGGSLSGPLMPHAESAMVIEQAVMATAQRRNIASVEMHSE